METLSPWFTARGWEVAPGWDMLPQQTGMVAYDGDVILACGFLYLSNSKCAFLEFTATNPKINAVRALRAMKKVVDELKRFAMSQGANVVMQFLVNEKFVDFYSKRLDFQAAGKHQLMIWTARGEQ